MDIYRELYLNTTPVGEWDKMMSSGETRKEGFFLNYVISEGKYDEIVERRLKESKIPEWEKKSIRINLLLGASPKFEQ